MCRYWLALASLLVLAGCGGGENDIVGAVPEQEIKQLTSNDEYFEGNPTFSPDAQWILFESDATGNMDIWRIPASGGAAEQLTSHGAFDSSPYWTPDGDGFVFESERSGTKSIWFQDLTLAEAEPVQLTDDSGDDGSPTVSPDGSRVAFESNRGKSFGDELWIAPLTGGPPVRLTETPAGTYHRTADWSRDGARLVFESNREDNSSAIYAIGVETGVVERITRLDGYEGHPAWSPDGAFVAFESTWSGVSEIWIVGDGGEDPRQVTDGGGFWPSWSPTGREIVYGAWSDDQPNVWKVSVDP